MKRLVTALVLMMAGCGSDDSTPEQVWDWGVPDGYPKPAVPEDNPMTQAKVELGRLLFYDTRLSANQTQSCGSCHLQELAFTDGLPQGIGSTEEVHPRSSMSLTNVGYASVLTWGNPLQRELEEQMLGPFFGETPVELGLKSQEQLVERVTADPEYVKQFAEVFGPGDGSPVDLDRVTKAIAAFQRSLISSDSPYDRYIYRGQSDAMNPSQRRGMELFFSERLECFHCHGGFNFSDSVQHDGSVFEEIAFHNNGLYNIGATGAYPEGNQGVFDISGVAEDAGRFKAPSLRNIGVTAPYMHDGSIDTLEEVVDHYARGGRLIAEGPDAGDGKFSPYKSELVNGFTLTDAEREDLVAFLNALTDETFLNNPDYADPWQ